MIARPHLAAVTVLCTSSAMRLTHSAHTSTGFQVPINITKLSVATWFRLRLRFFLRHVLQFKEVTLTLARTGTGAWFSHGGQERTTGTLLEWIENNKYADSDDRRWSRSVRAPHSLSWACRPRISPIAPLHMLILDVQARSTQIPSLYMLEACPLTNERRSASPFWRSRPAVSSRSTSGKSGQVIGAAYSHADMLKLDTLWVLTARFHHINIDQGRSLGGNSRPRTPPSRDPSRAPAASPPPASGASRFSPPQRPLYPTISSQSDWLHDSQSQDDTVEDEDDEFLYDDDEDEFGLPSLASIRRKQSKNRRQARSKDSGSSQYNGQSAFGAPSIHHRAGSFDIGDERSVLAYPSAKKPEGKILRPQYKDILRDPANALHLINHAPLPPGALPKETEAHATRLSRISKFKRILQASTVSLTDLRSAAWSGVPEEVRAMTWQLLLGYLPTNSERRVTVLERKRKEYLDGVRQAFNLDASGASTTQKKKSTAGLGSRGRGLDEAVWHQISIDVPRTNPHLKLYGYEATQRSLERILYVWALRHPASGYVQGINDLVTPFWQVFLGTYITDLDISEGMDPGQLPKPVLDAVEADSFWCLTKLLDGIQDNYIHAQPGIHRQVNALRDLTVRIDANLAKHLEQEGVEFMQFSFRWVNCLLMREVSIGNTIRMWDTYLVSTFPDLRTDFLPGLT